MNTLAIHKIIVGKLVDKKHIQFEFLNNEKRLFNIDSIIDYPVFGFLKTESNIPKFVVRGNCIEWTEFEADLSADTLYQMSKPV